jgi:hypothetical protein
MCIHGQSFLKDLMNLLLFPKKKKIPLLQWAYKCYPILNVGGVCVRVLMYSEPLGNKQSRTLKTQAGKAPHNP